ncbi:GerAB/ArcD/ProY family transporter [Candidatus Woesearchaeota archaeon]|nr:GerAB/ArcD/ProY family transporter [Candidatus Woesearchaeota archaeon]
MKKKEYEAIATLVGTIVGAGILGIPYVVAKAGFWTGIVNIVVLGAVVLVMYLYLGEVILRTKGKHQLTGYAEKYLGKWGKQLMAFSMIFGIYGALIAYILGEGLAFSAIFGGNPWIYSIGFFIIASFIVYRGLKMVAKAELWMMFGMIIVAVLIAIFAARHINPVNFTSFDIWKFFVPYGVILFATLGASAIPEMQQYLSRNLKSLKKCIIIGIMIPIIVYLVFAVSIVGVTGIKTTEIATIGLGMLIGEHMVLLGNIFAIVTMTTSFLALALALKQMYNFDYKLNKHLSWGLTIFIPLLVSLSGVTTFIMAIGIAGVVAGGIEGALIVFMAWQAKHLGDRKPEYKMKLNFVISVLLILLFIFGAVYYLSGMF